MILLDTHSAVWTSTNKRLLSAAASEAIRAQSRSAMGIAIASSSLWEIAMMSHKGRMRLPAPSDEYLRYVESMFIVLPITGAIAQRSMMFTNRYPGDPTDRIIGATAIIHGIPLVTRDKQIRASEEVNCIW